MQAAALSARTPRGSLLLPDRIPGIARRAGHSAAFLADACFVAAVPAFLSACRRERIPPVVGAWLPLAGAGPSERSPGTDVPGDILCTALDGDGLRWLGRLSGMVLAGGAAPMPLPMGALEGVPAESLHVTALSPEALSRLGERAGSVGAIRSGPGPGPAEGALRRAADKAGAPTLGLVPWRMAPKGRRTALASLLAAARRTTLEREARDLPEVCEALPAERLREMFQDAPELLANAGRLATLARAGGRTQGPAAGFALPGRAPGADDAELGWAAREGLERRFGGKPPAEHMDRLLDELEAIRETGFAAVFLTVAELARRVRAAGGATGPGRGSAAGSLVSWALGITHPDPVEEGLWFERFINVHRVSPPDFDFDVEPALQGWAQAELSRIWDGPQGPARSAPIASWAGLRHAASFRMACRARGVPQPQVDRALSLLRERDSEAWSDSGPDAGRESGGSGAPARNPESPFSSMPPGDRARLDAALLDVPGLTGATNAVSRHPAAIALLPGPADDRLARFRPAGEGPEAQPAIQIDHAEAERAGAVKVDVLALAALSLLKAVRADVGSPDPWTLPEDPRVYRRIALGDTTGVFQMESRGIRRAARELAPKGFQDLRALIALYRPGPMDQIEAFGRRSRGEEPPDPPHPALDELLAETKGIIVYQEQAMACAVEVAGFSPSEADSMRRAIGKKIPGEMERLRERFVQGALERDPALGEAGAGAIWRALERHAGYSFNKSHATCYALISYATAWHREMHPGPFLAAVAEAALDRPDREQRILEAAAAAARHGIRFEAPDLAWGTGRFRATTGEDGRESIIAPPRALKGVGAAACRMLDGAAQRMDRPRSSAGWARRMRREGLTKAQALTLAKAGAFRSVPGGRGAERRIEDAWSAPGGAGDGRGLFEPEREGVQEGTVTPPRAEKAEREGAWPPSLVLPLPPEPEMARLAWRIGAVRARDAGKGGREDLAGLVSGVHVRSAGFVLLSVGDATGEVELPLSKRLAEALTGSGGGAEAERVRSLCRPGAHVVASLERREGGRGRISALRALETDPEALPAALVLQLGRGVAPEGEEARAAVAEEVRRIAGPFSPGSARIDVALRRSAPPGGWERLDPGIRAAPSRELAKALEAAWPGSQAEILGTPVD